MRPSFPYQELFARRFSDGNLSEKLWKVRSFRKDSWQTVKNTGLMVNLARFSGHHSSTFHQQTKPCTDACLSIQVNPYLYDFRIDERSGLPKESIIFDLCESLGACYRTMVLDRGYSTLSLFEGLLERNLYAVGTDRLVKKVDKD
eukprot:TRINITY_DN13059_c3_g1_i2.p1 TRINITY_DN13059_c3_g1~~TRINITY_DN13059_c3_g1_i2.p1  ORF type:complete len:145 (+),score=27.12 TRINITY_DN13059_c3_g1_i2:19-453(+)